LRRRFLFLFRDNADMVRRLWRTISAQPTILPFTEWRIWLLAASIDRIISIELDPTLAEAARVRFAATPHITILQGNSGELLRRAIASLTGPALFWLDGHYSGSITPRGAQDSPITDEIDLILAHPTRGHVVLIDDARYFNDGAGYPTVDALREKILSRAPGSRVDVADNIITWIGPGAASA
jgi:hypothetical protein